MGKRHRGWSLSPPDRRTGIYFVRFTHRGVRKHLSTRTTAHAAAQIEAATIYAETVSGQRRQSRDRRDVAETMGEWLAEYEGVWSEAHFDARKSRSRTIANYFGTTDEITEESIKRFFNARLSKVTREAVKLERSALKGFCEWAAEAGYLPPIVIPPLPKGIKGKSAIDRPHVRLTPEQARTIIEALPERTKVTRKPIRTMMEAEWDTGLRAYGLWRLEAPKHYSRSGSLYVSGDIDKEGFARTLRLRPETSARLEAVAFMLGHTQQTTTVRYLDLHENVYTEAIEKRFSVAESVAVGDVVSVPAPNVPQSLPNETGAGDRAPARM